jgi:hypothetical protein
VAFRHVFSTCSVFDVKKHIVNFFQAHGRSCPVFL